MSWFSKTWKKLFGSSNKKTTTYLDKLKAESKTMLGHHDDTIEGYNWLSPIGKSDVYDVTGNYPKFIEFDLMGIELGRENYTSSIKYTDIKDEAIKQYNRGGYIGFSWHMFNPLTGKGVTSLDPKTVPAILDDESETSKTFWNGVDRAIEFIKTIKDSDGKQIPFIFRPFHECLNKATMWWTGGQCYNEEYIDLWQRLHRKMKDVFGDNIVFVYSPSSFYVSEDFYLSRYPGDDYVDIIGIEEYQNKYDIVEESRNNLNEKIDYNVKCTKKFADKHNKLFALTEAGIYMNYDPEPWTNCYSKVLNYNPLFINIWRNAYNTKASHGELSYAPYPGELSESDFKKFCKKLKMI